MTGFKTCMGFVLALMWTSIATQAQTAQQTEKLQVSGYSGEAAIIRVQGRPFVDLEALVHITGSSLTIERGGSILTLPGGQSPASAPGNQRSNPGFSQPFVSAGIEAIASMREWGSTLVVAMRNGFPIGTAIDPYRGRAVDQVRLAAAAASSPDDSKGLELLQKELSHVQNWSDKLVNARNSMTATNFTMSENAVEKDSELQAIVQCGKHLGEMFASGRYEDISACR